MLDLSTALTAYPDLLQNEKQGLPRGCLVRSVEKDAASVSPGDCFVAYRGERADGHCSIQEALRRGAAALVVENTDACPKDCPVPCILVFDGRAAYAALCFAEQRNPQNSLHLIGVTGTNGKTSVSTVLYHILQALGERAALVGTVRNVIDGVEIPSHMTTPDSKELAALLRLAADRGVSYAVLEVSSHALQQQRCYPLHFRAGIFTGLSEEHLDYHKTMERYFGAKKKLFEASDFFLCDADNPYTERLRQDPRLCDKCYTYSEMGPADFFIASSPSLPNTQFSLIRQGTSVFVRSALLGDFVAKNLTAAIGCAVLCGFSAEEAAKAAQDVHCIPGRMERVFLPCPFQVLIDFAHTPDALRTALCSARRLCRKGGRLLAVFGCGGDRDKEKRPRMGAIAAALADEIFLTNDNSRTEDPAQILAQIASGMQNACCMHIIPSRKEAIAAAFAAAKPNDILLLCGKGHETYEIDKDGTHPFSEKEILFALAADSLQQKQKNEDLTP